jgi:hypothetical protein
LLAVEQLTVVVAVSVVVVFLGSFLVEVVDGRFVEVVAGLAEVVVRALFVVEASLSTRDFAGAYSRSLGVHP